jgi:CoA:oxalate CoA-transferase
MTEPQRSGALAGIKVLDFTSVMAGPFATRMMADLGAEVIKVEPPGGDPMRTRPPLRDGHSSYFGALNCGKRSVVLDLKNPDGLAVAKRLAGMSDIVVENFRPGVMKRLGMDYASLSIGAPGLVYCSISGFGQTGPSSGKPAYAPIIHAASGYDLANMGYEKTTDRPAKTGIFMADVLGGVYAFGALQTALLHRERTGTGQMIDVSMLDAMVALQVFEAQQAQFPSDWRRPVYSPLKAADGFVVVAPTSQRIFERLCDVLGHLEWLKDHRFSTTEARDQSWEQLLSLIEDWTRQRSALECEEILLAAGVPCSRYRETADIMADPQLAHRGTLAKVEDEAGTFLVPNLPYLMSATPPQAGGSVSMPGADVDSILRDRLGCTEGELSAWRNSGALGDYIETETTVS